MDIVVRTTKPVGSYPAGAELGFATEATACKVLGDDVFEVVGTQSGQPITTKPKRAAPAKKRKGRKRAPKPKPTDSTPATEKQD